MSPESLTPQEHSIARLAVMRHFATIAQQTPALFSAPARINLIGEHTDYNHGFVLPAAIDRHIYFAIAVNEAPIFQIDSTDLKESVRFEKDNAAAPDQLWAKYFHCMIDVLKEKGHHFPPMICAFGGNIPIGSGLSSSAALTCGFIYALNELFGWNLTRLEIAQLAQASEHRVGLNCGIMDQYAVLHGKKNQVLQLDCLALTHQYFPLDLGDHSLVLFNSMVSHSLADSAYNDRRESCERVLHTIQEKHANVQSLRDIDFNLLAKFQNQLSPLDYQRVSFVLAENQRVIKTTKALSEGQLKTVGEYLYQSHEGLSKVYEVSCEELDFLVDNLREKMGVLGSRMMGGGFGGCTINLIQNDCIEQVANELTIAYQQKYNKTPAMHLVQTGDGVKREVVI